MVSCHNLPLFPAVVSIFFLFCLSACLAFPLSLSLSPCVRTHTDTHIHVTHTHTRQTHTYTHKHAHKHTHKHKHARTHTHTTFAKKGLLQVCNSAPDIHAEFRAGSMQPHVPFSYGAGAGGEAGTNPLTLTKEAKRRGDVLQQPLQQLQQPLQQQGRETGTNPVTLTTQIHRELSTSVDSDRLDGWEGEGCENRSKGRTPPSAAPSLAQLKGTSLLSILFSFKTLTRAPKADTDARTEMNVRQHTSTYVSIRQHTSADASTDTAGILIRTRGWFVGRNVCKIVIVYWRRGGQVS